MFAISVVLQGKLIPPPLLFTLTEFLTLYVKNVLELRKEGVMSGVPTAPVPILFAVILPVAPMTA
jgi:hypothetical protein